jgi:hypothetical protein
VRSSMSEKRKRRKAFAAEVDQPKSCKRRRETWKHAAEAKCVDGGTASQPTSGTEDVQWRAVRPHAMRPAALCNSPPQSHPCPPSAER